MSATLSTQRLLTEDIFSLLGIQNIQDAEKEEILDEMYKTVLARVYAPVYKALSPAEQEELDNQSPEQILEYLANKGYDIELLVAEEAVKYRVELATFFDELLAPEDSPVRA